MSNILLQDYNNSYNDIPHLTKIGNVNTETYSFKNVPQRRAMVTVNPTSAISANLLAGAQVDFRLENCIDRMSSGNAVFLRIGYSNTSGANCIVAPAESQLKMIQIYSNNGSNLLYQQNNSTESYVANNIVTSRTEHEGIAALKLTNANYATGVQTIPNGQSGYYYIPICPLFWKAIHFRPYTVSGNLLIRVQFESASANISSGSMTITEAVLRVSGYYESDEQKKMMINKALVPKNFFFNGPQRHVESLTLAASQTYTIRLSGIRGICPVIFFCIKLTSNIGSPGNAFTWVKVDNFEILDSANVSLTGFNPITSDEMLLSYAHQFDNLFLNNTNAHVHSFSQTPVADLAYGSLNGSVFFDGFHSLRFTTKSGLAGGTYEITVVSLCNENLKVSNSVVLASRA